MRCIAAFCFIFILLLGSVSAQYISGDIYIRDNGDASFSLETDVDLNLEGISFENGRLGGITSDLTNKQGGVWKVDLDFGSYETLLLDIHLPSSLEKIDSIEGVNNIIDFDGKVISLIGSNEDLFFNVEYELGSEADFGWIYLFLIIILITIVFYLFFKNSKRKKRKLEDIFPLINDQERKIIELLMKRPLRQKEIRKKLDIPKASFSRYLVNLEKKKLIIREGEGRNRVVRLK